MSQLVSVAATPFQLINALEAHAVYGGSTVEDVVLIVSRTDAENLLMQGVLARFDPPTVIWISDAEPAPQVAERVRRETQLDRQAATVFLSTNQYPWLRRLARELSDDRPVLFDDGTATLLLARRRRRRLWRLTNETSGRAHQTGRLKGRLVAPAILTDAFRPRAREFGSVEFFSIYMATGSRRDTWRRNTLTLLRDRRMKDERHTPVIVGSALVEARFVRESVYQDLVAGARAGMPTRPIYVAHRGEWSDKLERLADRIDLEIVRPQTSIELFLLDNAIAPDPLHAVVSTAIDSLGTIFPEVAVHTFPPRPDQIDSSWLRTGARRKLMAMLTLQAEAGVMHSPSASLRCRT